VLDDARLADVRDATLAARRQSGRPFHWHSERNAARAEMVEHVASLSGTEIIVAVCRPVASHRHERARAVCLVTLLDAVQALDPPVSCIVLERRTEMLDKRDAARIEGLVAGRRLTKELTYSFASKAEPLLWLADAVAGAVSAELRGDTRFAPTLARHSTWRPVPEVG
jgi:hypothetical protein